MIKKSIENGIDLNVKDDDGLTPLHLAARNGIVYNWSKAFPFSELNDRISTTWKWTTDWLIIISGLESIVDILLKSNADVNVRDSNGKLPFVLALEKGHERIAILIINNANFTLGQPDLDVFGVECNGNHENFIVGN